MAWPFKFASLGGVEFSVKTAQGGGGRKIVAHSIANGVEILEDLGPDESRHSFDAFIVAPLSIKSWDDAEAFSRKRAQDLRTVLQQPRVHTLVHPVLGSLACRVARWSFTDESSEQGGYLRFSLDLQEDHQEGLTISQAVQSPTGSAEATSQALEQAGSGDVVNNLDTSGTQAARDATAKEVSQFAVALQGLKTVGSEASALANKAVAIARNAKALAIAPAVLVMELVSAARDVERAVVDAFGALAAYEALGRLSPSFYASPEEAQNALLVSSLIRAAAAGGALRAAINVPWASYDDAIAHRDLLLELFGDLEDNAPDELFDALSGWRAALVGLVPGEDDRLPRIGTFTPTATMPALLIAWRLYGVAAREQEIVDRNRIRNPCLVLGGRPLEILVDGSR